MRKIVIITLTVLSTFLLFVGCQKSEAEAPQLNYYECNIQGVTFENTHKEFFSEESIQLLNDFFDKVTYIGTDEDVNDLYGGYTFTAIAFYDNNVYDKYYIVSDEYICFKEYENQNQRNEKWFQLDEESQKAYKQLLEDLGIEIVSTIKKK